MGKSNIKGQSMIELLIAVAIGGLLLGAAVASVILVLRINSDTQSNQIANSLALEYLDNIAAISQSNWLKIYCPPNTSCPGSKGPSSQLYLSPSGISYDLISGTTSTLVSEKSFTRYFSIENVNRNLCGINDIDSGVATTCSGGIGSAGIDEDPSTQKITVKIEWENNKSLTKIQYLTRNRNLIYRQSDWSGGSGQPYFSTSTLGTDINNKFDSSTNVDYSTTIGSIKQSSTLTDGNLSSSIFDNIATSTALNTIMWQGTRNGGDINFQIASSNSPSGPWNFKGPDGSASTYYTADSNIPIKINLKYHNNQRYFKYQIFILDNGGSGPVVDDVIINWSP